MKGNNSNFAAFSNLLKLILNSSQTQQIHGYKSSNLLKIRLFSSFGGHDRNRQGRRNVRNDFNGGRNYNNDDDDNNNNNTKFSGRNRGNFNAHQSFGNRGFDNSDGRPVRGDRQRSQFGGHNFDTGRDFRGRGRRDDGFSKPVSRDRGRPNLDLNLNDEFLKFDENDEGSGDVGEGKKDYQPSVRELLNKPMKEGSDFLGKFKLGDVGRESNEVHSRPPTQEEKMEVPEGADEIFRNMKKSGLIPNAVAMLDGLCKDGLVHEAMKLFGVMREKGTMPDVVVYTAVVEGFCQAHKLDDAKRIFKKMQDNGIVPNAFSYTILIKGLLKAKRLEDATDFCVEMLETGHSPNVPMFTELVDEFCKEKGVEDAQKVIGTLKQKGFFLDEKAIRVYLDKTGPTSPMVREAIFGPKKTMQRAT